MILAGIDEAGRGSLAGPIVACAVILPEGWATPLRDSKKLTPKQREGLEREITSRALIGYGGVNAWRIDKIGIQKANVDAMEGALLNLYMSGGVIPDRGYYQLRHHENGALIGDLDEEFVWEASIGQNFTQAFSCPGQGVIA